MKNLFDAKVAVMTKKQHDRKRNRALIGFIALASVLVTAYFLILPAITLSEGPECGLEEHQHSEGCFETITVPAHDELICLQAEHLHSDNCFDASGALICAVEEHIHTDDCFDYIEEYDETILICEKPEHVHSDECFQDQSEDGEKKEHRKDAAEHPVTKAPKSAAFNSNASISKYVEKLDGDDYYLNLTLNGNNFSAVNTGKLDLLFIIDTTGSMTYSMEGDQDNSCERWNAIVSSLNGVVDYINANGIDSQYAMVTFYAGGTGFTDAELQLTWTPDSSALTDRMDYLGNWLGGGTNYEAPFYELQHDTLLADSRPDAQTIVIFISDGEPNEYYNAYGSDVFDPYGETSLQNAMERLATLEGIDAFYALGVSSDTELTTLSTLAGAAPCSQTGAYQCTDEDELNAHLLEILEQLSVISISNVTVTDTFSEYAQITEDSTLILTVTDGNGNVVCTVESDGLYGSEVPVSVSCVLPATELNAEAELVLSYDPDTRQITLEFPDDYMLENGYTYKITVKIEPTELAYSEYASDGYNSIGDAYTGETSSGQAGFRSNTDATVTYDVPSESGKTDHYPHPVIQVSKSFELPTTGGGGKLPFYAAGSIITAAFGFLLFKKRKTGRDEV